MGAEKLIITPEPGIIRPDHPTEDEWVQYLAANLERHFKVGQKLVDAWMIMNGHLGSMADTAAYIEAKGRDTIFADVLADVIHLAWLRGTDISGVIKTAREHAAARAHGVEDPDLVPLVAAFMADGTLPREAIEQAYKLVAAEEAGA